MSLILIGLVLPLAVFSTFAFNCYVLVSLLTNENPAHKTFKIGISVIAAFIFCVFLFNKEIFGKASGIAIVTYGIVSGLLFGVYKEGKRAKAENSKSSSTPRSEMTSNQISFNKEEWLKVTGRLLLHSFLGLLVTFLLLGLLAILINRPLFP